jgi:hypothetical protein
MYTGLRPKYSLKGAKNMGPKARPSTYKLNCNVPTSYAIPKFIPFSAGAYPAAAQETLKSIGISAMTIAHFRHSGQFLGLAGSFGSNVSSESGSDVERAESVGEL